MSTLRIAVALGITVLWAAVYVVSIADRSYSPPGEITPVMLVAVGYLLGGEIIKIGRRNGAA